MCLNSSAMDLHKGPVSTETGMGRKVPGRVMTAKALAIGTRTSGTMPVSIENESKREAAADRGEEHACRPRLSGELELAQ